MAQASDASETRSLGEEPVDGEPGDGLERAGLLEQVRGALHDLDPVGADQPLGRAQVELQHLRIARADDQQRRRPHERQPVARQIGTPAPRDDGPHVVAERGRRPQRRAGAGRGPEVADRQAVRDGFVADPARHGLEPRRQQRDVEDEIPAALLVLGEKVEQQRREAGRLEASRHRPVARAEAAAAAAVGEDDEALGRLRDGEVAPQPQAVEIDLERADGGRGTGRRRGRRGCAGLGEQGEHVLVGHLAEVPVPVSDAHQLPRNGVADDLVGLLAQHVEPGRRPDRNGHDDPCRPAGAESPDGDEIGQAGRHAVVDDDHRPAADVGGRVGAPEELDRVADAPALALDDPVELLLCHAEAPGDRRVERGGAVLGEGPDAELGLRRGADLADDEHVERRAEGARDLRRDRHAATGKGDDERPLPDEAIEQDGEAAPRVSAVVEHHASIVPPARRPAICARPDGPGVFPKVFRHERAGTAG